MIHSQILQGPCLFLNEFDFHWLLTAVHAARRQCYAFRDGFIQEHSVEKGCLAHRDLNTSFL